MLDIASGSNSEGSEQSTVNLSRTKRWNGNSSARHTVDVEHLNVESTEGYSDIAEESSSASSSLGVLLRETKGQISTLFGNISQWLGGSSGNNAQVISSMVGETQTAYNHQDDSPLDEVLVSLDSVDDATTAEDPFYSTMSAQPSNQNSIGNNSKMWPHDDELETPVPSPEQSPSPSHCEYFSPHQVSDTKLDVLNRYTDLRLIGAGAQGVVVSAFDTVMKRKVAIKKLTNPFGNATHAKRAFRELVLLNMVDHVNVIRLYNCFTPQCELANFRDIYLVTEFMNANLTKVIRMDIDHERISFLLYQLLCGIHHLHKAGITHRDLKPSNIVVNHACKLKILDFGLARNTKERVTMTPYVVTRYYRAPEVILGAGYSENVDVWSVGCIFAELILGRVLFPGTDHVHQWTKILELMGTPAPDFIERLSPTVCSYVEKCPVMAPKPWEEIVPDSAFPPTNPDLPVLCPNNARDLLSKMLVVDPLHRINVKDALQHCYVKLWYEKDEAEAPPAKRYDDTVEKEEDIEAWRVKVFNVLQEYKERHDIYGRNGVDLQLLFKEQREKEAEDQKEKQRAKSEALKKREAEVRAKKRRDDDDGASTSGVCSGGDIASTSTNDGSMSGD